MIGMERIAATGLLDLARDLEMVACQLIGQGHESVQLSEVQYDQILQSADMLKHVVAAITR